MPQLISDIVILFGAGLSLLTSLGQLTLRERRAQNQNLVLLFLVMGLCLFHIYFLDTGLQLENPRLIFMFMTFSYLLGPILFIAYYYVIFPAKKLPVRKMLLYVPSMISFMLDVVYFFLPEGIQNEIIRGLFAGGEFGMLLPLRCFIAGSSVQMIVYLSYLLTILFKERKNHTHWSLLNVDIAYTILSMTAHTILVWGVIFGLGLVIRIGGIMSSLLLICAYVVGFRFPEFLHLLFIKAVRKSAKPPIAEHETIPAKEQLMKLMLDEKIYSEFEISLQDLADELSLTIHQTSHLINEHFDMNFNNFINSFRVEEARRLMIEEPSRSIISIAHEVGFSSKSAFYAAFSRFTGVTPTAFRRKNTKKTHVKVS